MQAGSIQQELIDRVSYDHSSFKNDNRSVNYLLEEATRGTSFSASIKPFQKMKNGRGTWFSLKDQHVGEDKWKRLLEEKEDFINTRT